MDVRTPFFQNIACVLIGVLFLNPIVATAAELALDAQAGSNAAVTQAANGVPMVNIATPNGSGLSHNKFTDFNVSQQGLILNNSAQALVQTQLGGYVVGNPNLKGGAANLILNEVNGGSPSQLKGYTEVAGKSAAVIVANPHGISCDGCGFINTPRVTLTTGKPVVEGGRLDRFDVDGGQISIEGDGLNAGNVSQFDLITRSAQINAELHANQLNVIAGRNEVDASTLAATAKADDGSAKPQLAIDSSALGGMYAGAIRLVGTEQGVGVKLAGDMAASAGDIQIDANGQLSMARTAASRDLQLKAENIELNADTFAGRNAVVEASGQTLVKESLAAAQQLTVKGGELLNQGVVEAGVRADGSLNNTAILNLQISTVKNPGTITSHGSLNSDVQTLDNRAGKLLSAGDSTLKAQTLENQGGRIVAQQSLDLTGTQLNNQGGEVLAQQAIKVTVANLNNQSGTLAGGELDLQLSATLNNQGGLIESASDLQLAANTLSNSGGKLRALGGEGDSRFVLGGLFNNDAGLVEIGSGAFALSSVGLSNLGGTVRHVGDQGFDINLAALGQAGGRFITNGAVDLSLDEWSNISSLQAKTLNIAINRLTQSATGALIAVDGITTSGERWENHGSIETDGALNLTLTGAYTGNGKLLTQGDLSLTADSADLGSDAELRSAGGAQFDISSGLSSAGKITSTNDLNIKAASLNNQGTLGSAAALHIEAAQLINQGGLLFSGGDMQLLADSISNLYADIYSIGSLTVAKNAAGNKSTLLENRSGSIESSGDMSLRAVTLTNRKEVFTSGKQLTSGSIGVVCYDCGGAHHNVDYVATERFNVTVEEDSAAARIHSGGNLNIQGDAIANRYSSLSASGNINITGVTLENMGAVSGIIERIRRFNTGRITDGTDERFRDRYIDPYNAQSLPKEVPSAMYRWALTSDIETNTPSGPGAPAIIQAGGNVSIQATQSLTNSSVLNNQTTQAGTTPGLNTQVTGNGQPLVVQLNAQLPADSQQLVVDPLAQPSFSLPQGQNGLFQLNNDPGYPYLIETNPAFASLSNFMNSGYLLDAVGYNPDQTQRRLGDGLYEQRLIQQAIAARTGKRFLAGLNSDEAQFKYLMDNAIASKQALNLAPGIALTAEQTAALTHDIVWMQEQVVNGQKVLVPVLYLAQANDRLAPSGALIQGQDVALISGSSLNNSGTLRASQNLSATANNIGNSGLMQAGERLSLLATDSIRNARGGIIAGKDVTAIAQKGDISNERTITQESRSGRKFSQLTSVVDNAAGIEASNDLTLSAGRDIQNIGGSLKAGGDASLNAGQDLVIASAEAENGQMRKDSRHFWSKSSTTQYGSDVQVGGDLSAEAGRDVAVIASKVKAGGDVDLLADRDVLIGAAANESSSEYRYKSSKKKVNKDDASVRQQGAEIEAGGSLLVVADNDLTLSASKLKAGDDSSLKAGHDLSLLAEANHDYSFYSKTQKKSGSFGQSTKKSTLRESEAITTVGSSVEASNDVSLYAGNDLSAVAGQVRAGNNIALDAEQDINILSGKNESSSSSSSTKSGSFGRGKSKQKEKYDSTNVASVINAGNDLTVNTSKAADGGMSIDGGRDVTVIGSQLKAGNDLLVGGTGDVAILSGVEEHGSYSKKTKSGFLGLSKSGKSQMKTKASQVASQLDAGNDVVIAAGNDVRLRASETTAGNDVELRAGLVTDTGDINLVSANDTAYTKSDEYKKKVGMSGADFAGLMLGSPSWGGDLTLAASKKAGKEAMSSTSVGSQVVADRDAALVAERDINVIGSGITGGRNVLLDAGRDVNVVAGSNSQQTTSWENTKTLGMLQDLDGNGFTTFVGEEKLKDKQVNGQQTAAASQIAAGLDLDVRAGRDITQQGSDLSAGYDLNLQAGRNIVIDAANEQSMSAREESQKRTGSSTTVNHNFDNTKNALEGAGKGDNAVSQASSTLKAVDGVSQFLSGPTADAHIGSTGQSQSFAQVEQSNRASTLSAGNDINLSANNDVEVRGGQFTAGRDINVTGKDVVFDVARGEQRFENEQSQSKGGIVGGTTGGFKVGIGGSSGTATQEGSQGTSSGSQLNAQRDVNLKASHDLSLIGTQVQAGRDIDLNAGNDLTIGAAGNDVGNEERRRNGGGEVGLTFGSQGVGIYASVNVGRGELDREGARQQEAYLYSGRDLNFESGRDTTVAGATLQGGNVTGEVGRNLTVSSVPDTGKASGKEFDLSATVTIGPGAGFSGSVGYGQTNGKTDWVGTQTSITARDKLDIRTEDHTQIDGAVIASQTGDLKLDTNTLGFRDIKGEDKERSYYLNAGGSYGAGQQDKSQEGKGEAGVNGWSLSGYEYEKEREQIVRATVGDGEIVVRSDAETGNDSTAGLNRDTGKSYEITKDEEERTDLYVSKSSLEAVEAAAVKISREIQAQRVSSDQIPDSAKQLLGDERALAMAKNMARNGLNPELMDSLSGETLSRLAGWSDTLGQYNEAVKQLENAIQQGKATVAEDGTIVFASITVNGTLNLKEQSLQKTLQLMTYLDTLPKEEAALALLGVQVMMGPVKAVVSLGVNGLVTLFLGGEIDQLKEKAAIGVTAGASDESWDEVNELHQQLKEEYARGESELNGDGWVMASRFLIDVAAGSFPGIGKKSDGVDFRINGVKGTGEAVSVGGKTCVYSCVVDGVVRYVGITDDIVKRGQAHLREKGIVITKIRGLEGLSRADAHAVEQTLIDFHGLGKDGGTLINKINSISKIKNPTKYEQGLIRGSELLKKVGYEGF